MKKVQKEKRGNIKGITLISLVITIIILIILAGVSINLVVGENGLFTKAREARQKFLNAQAEEEERLAELEMQIKDNENLPENTEKTPAGTEVKVPSKWLTTTPAYVETETGEIVKREVVTSNVRAIATGNGEEVPVPKGFYYVGGTIESGVVISDNIKDQNKYADYKPTEEVKEGIPAGVAYNNDGTVNIENSELKGNQFVWIPVELKDYKKEVWKNGEEEYKNATWETQAHSSELVQIKKYGGFYVGRYEAGTSEIELTVDSIKINFSEAHTASGWRNTDFSIRDDLSNHTATGKITSKAGEIPYYHSDYFTALKLCNNMYQTEYVQSGLVTGTMWDAIMKFIAGEDISIVTTASTWGNYNETTDGVTFIDGQGRYATVDSSTGSITTAFQPSDGSHYYGIRTTASTEGVKQKNLYDIAGNLWEWTQEAAYTNDGLERYILRGGSFHHVYSSSPACYRVNLTAADNSTNHGFRPALYIM